jgi:hypothetical protein
MPVPNAATAEHHSGTIELRRRRLDPSQRSSASMGGCRLQLPFAGLRIACKIHGDARRQENRTAALPTAPRIGSTSIACLAQDGTTRREEPVCPNRSTNPENRGDRSS